MNSSTLGLLGLDLLKYPRTPHLQGSRLQHGDLASDQVSYSRLAGRYIVVEEKLDGANSGISFSAGGEALIQSRGHYLVGGGRERQFGPLKRWVAAHEATLLSVLEDRYVTFGECMSKKHSVYYSALPHIWLEFDVWDRESESFLSTARRQALFAGVPVLSVPVLYAGIAPPRLSDLVALIKPSLARTADWRATFEQEVIRLGLDPVRAWQQTDKSDLAEGLYIKVEEEAETVERYKFVRHDFVQTILDADEHHLRQPYIPNRLIDGVDLYAPALSHGWSNLQGGRP